MEASNHDPKAVQNIEKELNVEIVPGTEVLVDDGNHHFIKSSDRILVPQPSDDPRDPLNWNTLWKNLTTVSVTFFSFAQGFSPLAIAPMFPILLKEFHSDLPSVIQFTGVTIIVLGFSNFIWMPLSAAFGRRPVLLLSILVSLASCIWKARAESYGSFMGACVLNGLGAGTGETLQPQMITDYIFLHDRGKYNTLYFASYFGALAFSPIVAGLMAEHVGWRNFWWLNVAINGASFVLSVFASPETRWQRKQTDLANTAPQSSNTSSEIEEKDAAPSDVERDIPTQEATGPLTQPQGGKPSKMQFNIYQKSTYWMQALLWDFWMPFRITAFPIVDFASFVVAWSAACFLTTNLTQAQAFSMPPYEYSAQKIGFFNFAPVIGMIIGLVTAGPLNDWISMRATRRNNGVREPEMRLPAMIPYTLIMILGNLVVGFGYQYHWDWRAIVIIGYTCAGIQVAALPAIASTYAIDSYKPVTGSIFVHITVVKNLWGYGLSRFITTWSVESKVGYLAPIMTNMCLTTLFCACGVLFWWKGKSLRRISGKSKIHDM